MSPSRRAHGESRRPGGPAVLTLVALALAVAAAGLAGWLALRPARQPAPPTYTSDQQNEAKATICAAVDLVRKGVSLNTNLTPPGGPDDVTGTLAVAANARISLADGGQYLLRRLDPATPGPLADAVRTFADRLLDIGAAATAGAQNSEPEQAARLKEADTANTAIVAACS